MAQGFWAQVRKHSHFTMRPSTLSDVRWATSPTRPVASGAGRRATAVALTLALLELAAPRTAFTRGTWQMRACAYSDRHSRTCRCAARSGGTSSDDKERPREGEMTLEEEFRTGKTLEAEFSQVLEARRRGKDIGREPGTDAKSDLEINARKAWRQASDVASGVDFSDGPTLFWALLLGLIALAWLLPLLHF
uniref:Uncharacterized protein n=1 Tax=Alexandrium catenella TaxID=2925 RepID=A0A7S1W0E5_ALECA